MMDIYDLPALNAILNAICTVLLVVGFVQAKRGARETHRNVMISAMLVSTLFLTSYLIYHSFAGATKFVGEGWARPVYFTILITHMILAVTLPFLVVAAVWRAAKGEIEKHRKIVRLAWPVWMYVSVTGVLVYLFLYQFFPSR